MTAETDLISTLRQRIRISPSESSVLGSLPVIFFGDALSARVATIGLNPSKFEYLDRNAKTLSGRDQRFASTGSLGAVSREELSDAQADQAIEVMRSYYDDGKPVMAPTSATSSFLREFSIAVQRIREAPNRYALAEGGTRQILLDRFPFTI